MAPFLRIPSCKPRATSTVGKTVDDSAPVVTCTSHRILLSRTMQFFELCQFQVIPIRKYHQRHVRVSTPPHKRGAPAPARSRSCFALYPTRRSDPRTLCKKKRYPLASEAPPWKIAVRLPARRHRIMTGCGKLSKKGTRYFAIPPSPKAVPDSQG